MHQHLRLGLGLSKGCLELVKDISPCNFENFCILVASSTKFSYLLKAVSMTYNSTIIG